MAESGQRSVLDGIALVTTYAVNPFILPPVFLLLVRTSLGAVDRQLTVLVVATVFYFVLPVALLIVLRRMDLVDSIEVRSRRKRSLPYAAGIALSTLAIPALWLASNRNGFIAALMSVFAVNLVLLFLINRRTKISVHAAGISGLAALAWFLFLLRSGISDAGSPLSADHVAFLSALVLLVCWSRVRLGAHTVREVSVGTVFGFCITLAELFVLYRVDNLL